MAKLQEGDMLFLPPFTYHSVAHTGSFNVNVDFQCLPDRHWLPAVREPLGAQQTPSRPPSDPLQTPTRPPPDPLQTPSSVSRTATGCPPCASH
eukprot:1025182-Prorocentrum_minimum.AAC.1